MRAALIGAGQIARQHLACLRETAGVEVVAVCDLSPAVAESAAERFGLPSWFTDHRAMLESAKPDVVHVTTPPSSHFRLAADALTHGAHVVLEKPATVTLGEVETLLGLARDRGRALVEDYNYVFNHAPQEILRRVKAGEFGAVVHVDVLICLDILGPSGFADPNVPHPCLGMAGGAIADFLPHLASLAHAFVGAHRGVRAVWTKRKPTVLPYDEFHAVVEAEGGTATLGFSASSQPDGFWLRVYGERAQAVANLFETRLTFSRLRGGPKPLQPMLNGLEEGRLVRRQAVGTLLGKFGAGAGAYEGLWELLRRTYRALGTGTSLPVTPQQVLEVNRLVAALKPEGGLR
jgi:predicted dehydrogenase